MSVVALLLIILTASGIAYSWIEGGTTYTMETEEDKGITIKAPENYPGTLNIDPGHTGTMTLINYDLDTRNYNDLIFSPMSSKDGENFYIPEAVNSSGNTTRYRAVTTNDVGKNHISFSFDYNVPDTTDVFYLALKAKPQITATKSGVAVSDVSPFRIMLSNGTDKYIFAGDGTAQTTNVVNSVGGGTTSFTTKATTNYITNSTTTKNRLFDYNDGYTGTIQVVVWLESSADASALNALHGSDITISFGLEVQFPYYLIGYNAYTTKWNTTIGDYIGQNSFSGGTITINGNSKTSKGMYKILEKSPITLKAEPKANYEFEGWYLIENGIESKLESTQLSISKTPTDDVFNLNYVDSVNGNNTYYEARFKEKPKYTISVAGSPTEGGTVSVGATNTATTTSYTGYKDSTAVLKAVAKDGYKFVGWYENADGTGDAVSTDAEHTVTISANKTYYALFRASQTTTIYIEKRDNFASGYHVWAYQKINGISSHYSGDTWPGDAAALDPAGSGYYVYKFDTADVGNFWVIISSNGGNQDPKDDGNANTNDGFMGELGNTYIITADSHMEQIGPGDMFTLHVAATPSAGGTAKVSGVTSFVENSDQVMIRNGDQIKLSASPKGSYIFDGWYKDANCTQLITNVANTTITVNKAANDDQEPTYYAKFKLPVNYTATAHAVTGSTNNSSVGGTVTIDTATAAAQVSKTVVEGTTVTFKATAKSGYAFEGWYTAVSGGTKLSGDLNYTATITGTTNVYARFKQSTSTSYTAKAYAVSNGTSSSTTGGKVQVTGGSAGASSTATVTSGTSVTFTATKVTGYTFSGWYTGATSGSLVSKDAEYTTTISGATTLYARFDRVIYFKPDTTNWTQANARFAAYVWDGSGNTWYSMTDDDGDGIYSAVIDPKYTNVIFCRMNPANTTNNWDNKWNQTGDLTIPSGKNYYQKTKTTWDGDTSGTWSTK